MKRRQATEQHGFTIIELLIATMVFSVVLLLLTIGILQIARVYYKGVTEANTQNVARSIIDDISQSIQFSGGNVTTAPGAVTPGTSFAFCIGNTQYSYTLGYQLEDTPNPGKFQSYHVLAENPVSGAPCASGTLAQDVRQPTIAGKELLGPHMRLSNLVVQNLAGAPNTYQITVRVVYGIDDILYSPSSPSLPSNGGAKLPDASCRGAQAGTQFCAVAQLSTVVQKRVE